MNNISGNYVGPEGYSSKGPVDEERLNKRVNKKLAKESIDDAQKAFSQGDVSGASRLYARAVDYAQEARRHGSAKEAIELEKIANEGLEQVARVI